MFLFVCLFVFWLNELVNSWPKIFVVYARKHIENVKKNIEESILSKSQFNYFIEKKMH